MKKQRFVVSALSVFLVFGMFSYNALAQTPPSGSPPSGTGGKGFEEHKAREIARIQAHLACVQAAQDHSALKACHERHGQPR
jgi:hypothetical protein